MLEGLGFLYSIPPVEAIVAERLRRLTRNQIPSGSAGSNPAGCEFFLIRELAGDPFIVKSFLSLSLSLSLCRDRVGRRKKMSVTLSLSLSLNQKRLLTLT